MRHTHPASWGPGHATPGHSRDSYLLGNRFTIYAELADILSIFFPGYFFLAINPPHTPNVRLYTGTIWIWPISSTHHPMSLLPSLGNLLPGNHFIRIWDYKLIGTKWRVSLVPIRTAPNSVYVFEIYSKGLRRTYWFRDYGLFICK